MRNRLLAAYFGTVAMLVAALVAGGALFYRDLTSGDPIDSVANRHAYDVVGWELRHFPEKWTRKVANLFEGEPSKADDDALVRRYFDLADEIAALERSGGDGARLDAARGERATIENDVESVLESRIADLLREQGLVMNPPLFSDVDLFFPPLDFELDRTPRVLAVSPRDHIELDRNYLLAAGLQPEQVAAIERETEESDVSALVVSSGGVATYPSVVSELASYESVVETAIHEWLHQYLVFYPLGRGYFSGAESRTLNETVANIAGEDLAAMYFERYPEQTEPPPDEPDDGQDGQAFDFRSEMRALRVEVEALLADGRVEEAERLMERRRDEFEAEGVYLRRINQAYFAFYGSYADTAGSIDPIGPKLATLRERVGSPGAFVLAARSLTSEVELDRLLAEG